MILAANDLDPTGVAYPTPAKLKLVGVISIEDENKLPWSGY